MSSGKTPSPRASFEAASVALTLPAALLGSALAGCAGLGVGGAPAVPEAAPARDLILQQELGERPAPEGPCPERSQPNVLEDPSAAVKRTALGLAYCLLAEGPEGLSVPAPTDTVRVHYSGWTPEGEMFDSSIERGEPTEFQLREVIGGWTEGLQLMTPGDKARMWIPGNLGYGRREPGQPAGTPPRGTLIFEIELLEVVGAKPPPSDASAVGSEPGT